MKKMAAYLTRLNQEVVLARLATGHEHNHQHSDFAFLHADVETQFQALTQTPADVLRHIGSPFAPDKDATQPLAQAACQLGSI